MSILESSRHELRIAHGLTLMTPSLRGWEAFPTPGALTHTSITWAFSPPAPQVPGVTLGSPLCPWCFGHPFGEVRDRVPQSRTQVSTEIRTSPYSSASTFTTPPSVRVKIEPGIDTFINLSDLSDGDEPVHSAYTVEPSSSSLRPPSQTPLS